MCIICRLYILPPLSPTFARWGENSPQRGKIPPSSYGGAPNDAKLSTWSTGQEHETFNFSGQEIKDQSRRRPKLDVEAWRRHHFRVSTPLGRVVFLVIVTFGTWNLQLQWPGDQRSKSQETEVRCGGLAEASFSSFDPVGSSSVSSYCDLFEHRVTVTFDLLTEKLIVSRPCPVDHLCQLTSKSFIRCQSVMFTSLVTATNGHTHGRTTDNLIT